MIVLLITGNLEKNLHELVSEERLRQLAQKELQHAGHVKGTVLLENAVDLLAVVRAVVLVVTLVEHRQFVLQVLCVRWK